MYTSTSVRLSAVIAISMHPIAALSRTRLESFLMNTQTIVKSASLAVLLVGGISFNAMAEAPAASKITPEEFRAKLKKDEAPLPSGGQMAMSYANVAEKILPTVVRITTYGTVKSGGFGGFGGGGQGNVPPEEMRDFLRKYFGLPEGGDGNDPFDGSGDDEEQQQRPRGRGKGKNPQRAAPKSQEQKTGTGSGVIVTTDGYILTNNHVVAEATKLEVNVGNESKTYVAKVIGHDPLTDVAVIKIEAINLPCAVIGDSSKLRVGDVVLAAGNPMNLSQTITHGIVSAVGRIGMGIVHQGRSGGFENFIQTDASINPGNSGGPLVDGMGRVVGINTAIMTQTGMSAGIGFSIPINMALSVGEDLLNGGKVSRGFLGISMKDLDSDTARLLGVGDSGGVLVEAVVAGSPAQKAGVLEGDVISSAGGQHVENSYGLRSVVGSSKPGTKMVFDVIRDNKPLKLTVTLAGASDEELLAGRVSRNKPDAAPAEAKPSDQAIAGVTMEEISPSLRQRYSIAADVSGLVVTKVEKDSPAATSGLAEGDVIISINSHPVKTVAEASTQTKNSEKRVSLRFVRKGERKFIVVSKDGAGE
ncbi:MAG: Serine protease Do [Verrucomicrobiaceae bacterium]|nr:Serine protease Do [Verrucomicrobiaceae bacterium]